MWHMLERLRGYDKDAVLFLGLAQWSVRGKKGWLPTANKAFWSFVKKHHRYIVLVNEYYTSQVRRSLRGNLSPTAEVL